MRNAGIVPVKSLGTAGTRHTNINTSIGTTSSSAGVRYTAGIVAWQHTGRVGRPPLKQQTKIVYGSRHPDTEKKSSAESRDITTK